MYLVDLVEDNNMPAAVVMKLISQVTELERKVAVLMSWHKVTVGMLSAIFLGVVRLLWK